MITTLFAIALSQTAHAIPAQFTHQGRLLDAEGAPLTDEATITFRISNAETGGYNIWEETQTVSLNNGFYSAILGADEDGNPLDIEILSQAPVWMEIQLEGKPAMFPRTPIHSVPYATMARIAKEVSGGPVNTTELLVDGKLVIDGSGAWVGTSSATSWSDIADVPAGFSDGTDEDTMAELATSCLDGDVPVWDAIFEAWACSNDQDTLAGIFCSEGQVIQWSDASTGWVCGDDANTQLTADEVDTMVADNGYAMASEVFSGSFLDLDDLPTGLDDGDDNTQLSESEVDAMVSDNGFALASDLFSTLFSDLTEVPEGLLDGDDDTLSTLSCEIGQTAVFTETGWACQDAGAGASATSTANDALGSGEHVELTLDDENIVAAAWVQSSDGKWRSVGSSLSQSTTGCSICGDGSSGAYDPGGTAEVTLASGLWQFTDFQVPSWQTIHVEGSDPLEIRATGIIDIQGTIILDGETATSRTGGMGVAGGFNGGTGGSRSGGSAGGGPGGGSGGARTNDGGNGTSATYDVDGVLQQWWLLDSPVADNMVGGSGGGGGGGYSWSSGGSACGGGGAGGGVIALLSRSISVSGNIYSRGGSGRSRSDCSIGGGGGRGSGGAVLMRATSVDVTGTVDVSGSNSGLVRIDAHDLSVPEGLGYWSGGLKNVPDYLELYQPTPGTVRLQNNSGETQAVRLVAMQ